MVEPVTPDERLVEPRPTGPVDIDKLLHLAAAAGIPVARWTGETFEVHYRPRLTQKTSTPRPVLNDRGQAAAPVPLPISPRGAREAGTELLTAKIQRELGTRVPRGRRR